MSFREPSDAQVRREALDPSRSFLIQAPAGSGKTELLTDRILALLAIVSRPEEIVAITFTRKAASEMHARVLSKLHDGLGPEPPESHKKNSWRLARQAMQRDEELGWQLLHYPARLGVRTIDSFCAGLVRGMPWLSALGGMPAVSDNPREHYDAAAKATLAMVDESEAVARLISHMDVDVRATAELLAAMLGSRDQWLPWLAGGSDTARLLDNLKEAVEADLHRTASAMPPGWASGLSSPIVSAARALMDSDAPCHFSVLADWDGSSLGDDYDDLPKWQALASLLLTTTHTLRRRVDKRLGFGPRTQHKTDFTEWLDACDDGEPWVSALADLRCAPVGGYSDEQLDVLSDLLEVLWIAAAHLKISFSEKGEVDFIEIALRAVQALGHSDDPTDLLLALDASIKHLLVDEFQDTSQSQIALLERLTAGWIAGDGRTLFLVGDPMQSIYRFRKAEVGWFLKVKESGLGDVSLSPLKLTNNFRSQANVVTWVNQVFAPLFPAVSEPSMGAISYTDSEAYHEALDGLGVEFHPIWVPPEEGASDDATKASEAIAIQLARDALARHADSPHPVAILVRARSHLGDVVRRLGQAGVPCRAVELVSLKSRQAVSDMVQMARALSHPGDRLAWLSLLRSPLCGLALDSLHALFSADHERTVPSILKQWLAGEQGQTSDLPPNETLRLQRVAAVLLDDSNASGSIPFAAWVQQCWVRLDGPAVYPEQADQSDIESLLRLIEKLAPYGGLDPVRLDEQIEQLYAAPNNTGHAVEVMTIHKSKGLQFDTVILMGLHRRPPADKTPLLRFEFDDEKLLLGPIKHRSLDDPDPVSLYLAEREKKRASHEADRLLYVAATRAREQLHLIGELALDDEGQIRAPVASSLLGRLWPYIETPCPPTLDELKPDARESRQPFGGRDLLRVHEESLLPVAQVTRSTSPQGGWQWSAQVAHEAVIGTVAHAWLERIGRDGLEAWPPQRLQSCLPILIKQLSRAGVVAAEQIAAAHAVRDTLMATLVSARGQWLLRAARAYREWSLLDMTGRVSVIDLAISEEHGWLVVDYKTGVPAPDEDAASFAQRMRVRHGEQLARYCRHVSELDGRPARAALYFPRADLWLDV